MTIGKMVIFKWMSGNIFEDLQVAPSEDKMRETRIRWFGHVKMRAINALESKT